MIDLLAVYLAVFGLSLAASVLVGAIVAGAALWLRRLRWRRGARRLVVPLYHQQTCALTCAGGSERRGCPCRSPHDCVWRPR